MRGKRSVCLITHPSDKTVESIASTLTHQILPFRVKNVETEV